MPNRSRSSWRRARADRRRGEGVRRRAAQPTTTSVVVANRAAQPKAAVTSSVTTAKPAATTTPLAELNLTVRVYNPLMREGIVYVEQLADRTADNLLDIRGIGTRSLDEIRAKLPGHKLKGD